MHFSYRCIDIVIPVFNEKDNIEATIEKINKAIINKTKIYAVYDFDDDDTLPVLRKLMVKQSNIFLLKNKFGKGALNAIRTGMARADDCAVLVMMADLSDDISIVDFMFEKLNDGFDIICGSRYMKGGRQIGGPLFKKMLSRTAGLLLYYLAGIPTQDVTNSFKMYSPRVLKAIDIESKGGFELGMEIVIKAYKKGFKITQLPSTWRDRETGTSNFKLWIWLPSYLKWFLYAFKR